MSALLDLILAKQKESPRLKIPSQLGDTISLDQRDKQEILEAIRAISDKFEKQNPKSKYGFVGLDATAELLTKYHITETLIDHFVSTIKETFSVQDLQNIDLINKQILPFFTKCLRIYQEKKVKSKQRIIVLLGASGVGKTSTAFKLATHLELKQKKGLLETKDAKIRIACLDNQKIAFNEYLYQMSAYMDLETNLCTNFNILDEYIRKGHRPDILIIDTNSINPNDNDEILKFSLELNTIVNKADVFLIIPANLGEQDMLFMLEQYRLLKYSGIIISKIDETQVPTKILGLCMEYTLPIAYISKGPQITDYLVEGKEINLVEYFKGIN